MAQELSLEARLKWWQEARFGMFIHWGLYAIPAGEWRGEKVPGIGEWIMHNGKIPIAEYERLADSFNPVQFDAEVWADIAEKAGMKYLVITAKHHDGFCMFDSASNPYNIVDRTPFKRDPMKELAAACAKRGIRMCFYYSQAQDWHAPGGAGHWEEAEAGKGWHAYTRPEADFEKYLDDVVRPNLRELLTNYGPIGLIWFDTPVHITQAQSESLRDLVHELQPGCLVSGRVGHGVGDYGSLGDNQHPAGPVSGAWETPATLNDTWGFKRDDENWKSAEALLGLLVNCAAKGVNYLLNVGPTAEGVIPQPSVELLEQVGAWLKRNGEAIYGTAASPFPLDFAWGGVTVKGNWLYLLIREWPQCPIVLQGLRNRVVTAHLPAAPERAVEVRQEDGELTLSLPAEAPEPIVSVVVLELDGEAEVDPRVIQEEGAAIRLPVNVGDIEGRLSVHPSGVVQGWTGADGAVVWRFVVKTPGTYRPAAVARVHRNRRDSTGYPTIRLICGDAEQSGSLDLATLDMAAGAKAYQNVRGQLGSLTFPKAGEYTIQITADGFSGDARDGLMLVAVELEPTT